MRKYIKNQYNLSLVILGIGVVVSIFLSVSRIWETKVELQNKVKAGENLVRTLYEFDTVDQLEKQFERLDSYVSNEVLDQLNLDSDSRALSVYLKFKLHKSEVNILESTPNFVKYKLITKYISPSRIFMLTFVWDDKTQKISKISEYEMLPFPTNLE